MYHRVAQYKKQEIQTASPRKLIVMLYDGAIRQLDIAEDAQKKQNYQTMVTAISKCRNIILELIGALDFNKGGDIASNLRSLYVYIIQRINTYNNKQDLSGLIEAREILVDLRGAWEEICKIKEPSLSEYSQTG